MCEIELSSLAVKFIGRVSEERPSVIGSSREEVCIDVVSQVQ